MAGARPPGVEEVIYSWSQDHTDCPHCGRYVGPLELCPYCRRRHRKRSIVTWMKYGSPVAAIAGMVLLGYLGQTLGTPRVKLGDLSRTSNFAYLEVEGEVCDEPRFYHVPGSDDPTAGTLEFCLDDGTGQTRVKTFEDATRRIVQARKIPAPGDRVKVIGNYQARVHKHSLIVGSPHEIEILSPPPTSAFSAAQLARLGPQELAENARVVVEGYVAFNYNDREKGKYSAVIHLSARERGEEQGRKRYLRVELPWSRLEMDGTIARGATSWPDIPPKGSKVRVTGAARYSTYGREPGWRVHPAWGQEIEILSRPREGRGGKP